jgi:transposase
MDVNLLAAQVQELMKLKEELQRNYDSVRCDYEALRAATEQVIEQRDQLQQQVEELRVTNKQLTHMLWGRKSERRPGDPGDRLLPEFVPQFAEPQDAAVITATEQLQEKLDEEIIAAYRARQAKRQKQPRSEEIPAHIERRERLLDLPEEEKDGLTYIGDAVTERLELERPKVYVDRIVRRQYVRSENRAAGVLAPPVPLGIVEGAKYGFDVIASMIALKYAFHQPTYRQQDWFAQCGWTPRRSTINDMIQLGVETTVPLYAQLYYELLRQNIILADETTLLLLTRGALTEEQLAQLRKRRKSTDAADDGGQPAGPSGSVTSYAWLLLGLDGLAPFNVFHWSLTREATTIDALLSSFHGTVVADAYDAYTEIERRSQGRIVHASCNVHARREFVEAETYEPILCAQIQSLYGQLYEIEERGKSMSLADKLALRQQESTRIWDRIAAWLEQPEVRLAALPKSRFGKAVGYLKNQWSALQRYLTDPRLPIDNDQAEQTIRPLTVGRRNWLFLGHPQAAPGRMQLLSIVSSAQRHHLVIEEYLADVLRQLADAKQHRPQDLELGSPYLRNLLPDRWAEQHPQSIRRARVEENSARAEAKRARRALRRQEERRQKRANA